MFYSKLNWLLLNKCRVVLLVSLLMSSLVQAAEPSFSERAQLLPEVILPSPEPGSFFTAFSYLSDGRIVAFDGFTVFIQEQTSSPNFVAIGSLPETFRGGTDPVFVVVAPSGREVILGGGAGGAKFPDPSFNGNIFRMSLQGGEATLIGQFPFHIQATFRGPHQLVFSQGETFGVLTGSVEMLNLATGSQITLVANVPGDPSGVSFRKGNLYVGLGLGQDQARTGEIRQFDRRDVTRAIQTGVPLDFDTESTLITQFLSGGDLPFDSQGDLFVGGGDFFGVTGSFGFFAEFDTKNGEVTKFDPTDGDPNDGDSVFFSLKIGAPRQCRLGAVDSFSVPPKVFQMNVCEP